jgi:hypothetical protein
MRAGVETGLPAPSGDGRDASHARCRDAPAAFCAPWMRSWTTSVLSRRRRAASSVH